MKSFRKFMQRLPFYGAYKSLSHYPDYWYWKLRAHPVRSPHLLKQRTVLEYARKFGLRGLVETGTYYGEMVAAVKKHFDRIDSIEYDHALAQRAIRRFARDPKIHILEGDSAVVLPELLKSLDAPALFWLDAGYWGWEKLARDPGRLSAEVEAILAHSVKGHVILMDDARMLNGQNGALTLAEFQSRVAARFPGHAFEVRNDIVRITPRSVPPQVKSGLQSPQGAGVLENHPPQSIAPVGGWKSIVFGLPFMLGGDLIGLVALDRISGRHSALGWPIGFVAILFLLGGLFFLVHGLNGVMRRAAWKRELAAGPPEPWLYDFHWDRDGVSFSAFSEMVRRLFVAMTWTATLVPFGWLGLHLRVAWPFFVVAAALGLVALVFWGRWAVTLLDLISYGDSYLNYESFPFALGGLLRVQLRPPRHFGHIDELTFTLRCVEEKYAAGGAGRGQAGRVVCYELYKDVVQIEHDYLRDLGVGSIPVQFHVPLDQPATNLAAVPPVYWEIAANGKTRGIDYEAFFLVPVYKTS